MEFDVTATTGPVDFAPGSIQAEVIQNVRTILGTLVGTVPLDREFGTEWSYVDAPLPVAQARIQQDVIAKIRRYEPRAVIVSILVNANNANDGQLTPTVRIRIDGD